MEVDVIQGSIVTAVADAIVSPINSYGIMHHEELAGTVPDALYAHIEEGVAQKLQDHAPLRVGSAIETSAGDLAATYIIHTPLTEQVREPVPAKAVELATVAALRKADELGCETIAMPALGVQIADVDPEECARIMRETIAMYMVDNALTRVQLYSEDAAMCAAWNAHTI